MLLFSGLVLRCSYQLDTYCIITRYIHLYKTCIQIYSALKKARYYIIIYYMRGRRRPDVDLMSGQSRTKEVI